MGAFYSEINYLPEMKIHQKRVKIRCKNNAHSPLIMYLNYLPCRVFTTLAPVISKFNALPCKKMMKLTLTSIG